MPQQKPFDVFSIGTPCIDRLVRCSHEYVESIPGKRGGSKDVDHPTLLKLLEKSGGKEELVAGGAATNTLRALAQLGHSCGAAGTISNDNLGRLFIESFEGLPITPLYRQSKLPMSQVLCLITPDGDRTQRAYTGSSIEMRPEQLERDCFKGCKLLALEGFSLRNEGLLEAAMEIGKEEGCQIALGLSSFEMVHEHRDRLLNILPKYVDLVFANQDEARALTGIDEKESAIALSKLCKAAIVTRGPKGCWVAEKGHAYDFQTTPIEAIDATGAGDLFMAGFLHGYLRDEPWERCAHYGSAMGGAVTQVIGPIIPKEWWQSSSLL